jgi:DNA replication and repair protein RecF
LHVERIRLTNFRNFARAEVAFAERRNLIVGPNAQGKTNILEAVHLLCVGRSHRDRRDRNLIRFGEALFRVEGTFEHIGVKTTIEVACGEDRGEERKRIRVNSKEVRPAGLVGIAPVVISSPDDIDLVKRSPGYRRAFLDKALSQVSKEYLATLQRYARALAHRNVLLRRAQETRTIPAEIEAWDEALAGAGERIVAERVAFLEEIAPAVEENVGAMSGAAIKIGFVYEPRGYELGDVGGLGGGGELGEGGACGEGGALAAVLAANRRLEVARGFTVFGPHVDDFKFLCDGRDIRLFGSEGEQRTGVLALRCAEVETMRAKIGYHPIVLLDDVFAELDEVRSRALTALISGFDQIVLTSSRPGPPAERGIEEIIVAEGRITYGG